MNRLRFLTDESILHYQATGEWEENYGTSVLDYTAPKSFDEYVGQKEAKDLVRIMVGAALKQHRTLPNVLLVGGYGLGKSALARLIIEAVGLPARLTDASTINRGNLPSGTLILDEIHNLKPDRQDSLNVSIDAGKVVIIGCTTNSGLLTSPFRSRFRIINLKPYSVTELVTILSQVCKKKIIKYDSDALRTIAQRSRNNARAGINYLSFILDMLEVENKITVSSSLVKSAFEKLEVDKNGYTQRDYAYMSALPNRPVGLGWLSSVLGIDTQTIQDELEPYLMQTGLIDRQPRGRIKINEIPG